MSEDILKFSQLMKTKSTLGDVLCCNSGICIVIFKHPSLSTPPFLLQPGMKKGDILGHEIMGYVESVGSKVDSVKVGDRVVVSCLIFCGECRYCKNQEYSLCDK